MKKVLLSAVATVALAAPVFAADLPARTYAKAPPMAVPVMSWSGCYVGANVGGDWSKARFDNVNRNTEGYGLGLGASSPIAAPYYNRDMTNDLNGSGFVGGGQVGCNYQTSNFVIGWESDLQYTDLHRDLLLNSNFGVNLYTVTQSFSSKWLNTDRVRVGVASGAWLFYATGGLAAANVRYSDGLLNTANGGTVQGVPMVGSVSTTRVGWTAGVGTEYMLNGNWSVKGEYLYVDMGRTSSVASAANGGNFTLPLAFINIDHRLTENIVRVGLNYHFGGPVVAKY